jgi:hypothetical protein
MSNNFHGEGPDSTRIAAEVLASDPINFFLSVRIYLLRPDNHSTRMVQISGGYDMIIFQQ